MQPFVNGEVVSESNPLPVMIIGGIGGGGDMLKSVYDTDDSGKVDVAELAESVDWADVTNKPSTFTPATHTQAFTTITGVATAAQIPTLAQSKVTNLTTDLAAKLTASAAVTQADSVATDIEGLLVDFNALLLKLKNAGLMS